MTYLRLGVNVAVSMLLGTLFLQIGNDGSKIFDNYNLLFSILMHHVGSTLMLNIINCKIYNNYNNNNGSQNKCGYSLHSIMFY